MNHYSSSSEQLAGNTSPRSGAKQTNAAYSDGITVHTRWHACPHARPHARTQARPQAHTDTHGGHQLFELLNVHLLCFVSG